MNRSLLLERGALLLFRSQEEERLWLSRLIWLFAMPES